MAFDLTAHRAEQFNYWIADALSELRRLSQFRFPTARGSVLRTVRSCVKAALRYANTLGCRARKALCIRVLNWLRADLRRMGE